MGMSGMESLLSNAVTKALENPAIAEKLTQFLGIVENVNKRTASIEDALLRIEGKQDRIILMLSTEVDPDMSIAVLDSISVMAENFGENSPLRITESSQT